MVSSGVRAHPDRFLPPDPRVEEPYRFTPQMGLRVAILGVLALGIFAVLFLRLWALQVLSGTRYLGAAQNNQIRNIEIEARRGAILDRNGRVLVTNVAARSVVLWPAQMFKQKGRDTEIRRLAAVLNVSRARILREIEEHEADPATPITLVRGAHREQIQYLREHQDEFPGVEIRATYLRRYNSEALAAHVLGHVGEISPEQLEERRDLRPGARVGQSGVEAEYDSYLRGIPGRAEQRVDSLGRDQGVREPVQQPEPGNALRLTIDIELQRATERALRYGIEIARRDGQWAANGGAAVVLDPDDGAILALASNPTYRPGVWVGRPDREDLKVFLDREAAKKANYPGLNRAIAGRYPPGSTFKPVTALAAIQERVVSPYEPLSCTGSYEASGQVFKNWDPYVNRAMSMAEALEASCDTYFYQLGLRFYGLPPDRGPALQAWASRFGFGERTGVDLAPEDAGLLPTPAWRKATYTKETDPCCWEIDRLWKPGDSIQLAIGQKDLLVTPLQLARFYAMIANDGKLVTPHVAADVEQPGDGRTPAKVLRRFSPPPAPRSGVDPAALAVVQDGLYRATHGSEGTATAVFGNFPVRVAGKTGTAEKVVQLPGYPPGHKEDQSWFCGYGPVEKPEIVACVLIENGGHGGTAAAPATLRIFEHYFHVDAPQIGEVYSD